MYQAECKRTTGCILFLSTKPYRRHPSCSLLHLRSSLRRHKRQSPPWTITTIQQCTQRWNEEKEKTEAAHAGLAELEARTMARLEDLGQTLKDRQSTVLAALKHEREVGWWAGGSLA